MSAILEELMSAAETTPLLEVRDLRVRFGAFEAVHGASFSLAPGKPWASSASPARASRRRALR
ncbi:hypothetical protein ACFQBQ_12710 [Granulicella cerasi]|uniref:Uncharacterized protein n=1 Tax=Granulicella cerasi TaxID=741063 RepID=A0ABW1ZDE0_9BACT